MVYILAISFGVGNYISRMLPYSLLHSLAMTSILAFLVNLKEFESFLKQLVLRKYLIIGIFAILSISVLRYFLFYYPDYLLIPIIRQMSSLVLGLITFFFFERTLKNVSIQKITNAFLLTAIPVMLIGINQNLNRQLVGFFPRITSLFSEPSYYGDYLVLVIAPFLLFNILGFLKLSRAQKILTISVFAMWCFSIYAVQSGTALIKLVSLIGLFLLFFPAARKTKVLIFIATLLVCFAVLFVGLSYTKAIAYYLLDVMKEPKLFFEIHTFYDRIYPLYSSAKNLFSFSGIIGLGFGGDYYEFKNLYPPSTHLEMIIAKPSLSYFNSLASKVILYMGLAGLGWYYMQIKKVMIIIDPFIKTCFMNILIVSLWGVPNFSLPYLWLWMALAEKDILINKDLNFQF